MGEIFDLFKEGIRFIAEQISTCYIPSGISAFVTPMEIAKNPSGLIGAVYIVVIISYIYIIVISDCKSHLIIYFIGGILRLRLVHMMVLQVAYTSTGGWNLFYSIIASPFMYIVLVLALGFEYLVSECCDSDSFYKTIAINVVSVILFNTVILKFVLYLFS